MVHKYVGCLFYHVQGMKPDRGLTNYYFDETPDSRYQGRRPIGVETI